ncbi:unnamed protein product [Rotaria sp. Silwood2]|nr:unnamed protein product [Rotaria sp. Silwood2]CAF2513046.1 unnamed protein product [Rotaria sp. Silwood2]CAF2747648.1 unnamed protein product [Rotaria sp. Silwood2]CAF2892049.1 unnamed protein product [Rotaria sp. Silwood2]CAF3913825.1 unnamed protein product [Rotaria sp. Silwood2]
MTYEQLNRRLAILAATFAFLGVILGVIALSTNYWTFIIPIEFYNETNVTNIQSNAYGWNGLFQACRTDASCIAQSSTSTFIVCFLGVSFLLTGGIFSVLDIPKANEHRFITPLLIFIGCILMTAGLVYYASLNFLNYHSSRTMIAAIVFAYTALPISAFVTGRTSALGRTVLINNEHHGIQKYSTTNGNGL